MKDVSEVADEIASQRIRLGLSLDEAARASDIDEERLAGAEEGETLLSEDELSRLAETYGVAVTAFFGGRITAKEYLFGA